MNPPYEAPPGGYDEAIDGRGGLRSASQAVLASVQESGPEELADRVNRRCADAGIVFHSYSGDQSFLIDPVPRVIEAAEWAQLERGLTQRALALNAFVDDVYGRRAIVTDGVLQSRVIDEAEHLDPGAAGLRPAGGVWIGVCGIDVARDADGRFVVIEDNVRTPSGIAYAMAARELVSAEITGGTSPAVRQLGIGLEMLRTALLAAAPAIAPEEPLVVLLSDGPHNSAWWEHQTLARRLGIALVTSGDVDARDGRLWLREADRAVDVVYRRTNAARSGSAVGRLLSEPLAKGNLGIVNSFGTGVADDKLVHAYVDDMVSYYLGEEPLLPSVPAYDLGDPGARAEALDRIDELVVKPRGGSGGTGVVICSQSTKTELAALRNAIADNPARYIAQETVSLSTHPTVIDGILRPRHIDLRPFVFMTSPTTAEVMPGGLTRVALQEGSLIVNSSQNGGAKDTWVLS